MSRFYPYGCYSLVAGVARPAVAGAGCIESCGSAAAYPVVIPQSGLSKAQGNRILGKFQVFGQKEVAPYPEWV